MLLATVALTFATAPLAAQSAGSATDKPPAKAADHAVMAKQGEMKEMHMPKECEMTPEMKAKHEAEMTKKDGKMQDGMEKKDVGMKHEAMDEKDAMQHDAMMQKDGMKDEKCMEAMHKAEQKGGMMHKMPETSEKKGATTEKKPDETAGKKPR